MSERDVVYPKEDNLPESNTNVNDLKFESKNDENEFADSDTVLTLKNGIKIKHRKVKKYSLRSIQRKNRP